MSDLGMFGAKAKVHIRHEGDIHSLAGILAEGLHIKWELEAREQPPYDMMGSTEVLGFEIWLEQAHSKYDHQYELTIQTQLSLKEVMADRMFDLSQWLAKFIATICSLKVEAAFHAES